MRISRLFVDLDLTSGDTIKLPDESAHYVRTVLRLKKDQKITLFNGQGGEFCGCLQLVSKKSVCVLLDKFEDRSVESSLKISIGLGISRGDRMDWSVQKSVELGVHSITPLFTDHCVIKMNAEKQQQRLRHWRSIMQHAAEQSGRTFLPDMPDCCRLEDWVTQKHSGLKLFLDPYATTTIAELQNSNNAVSLLTGPEGGFSEQERELAMTEGFTPVQMGPRILRTETAALSAIASAQTLWGDFR